MEWICDVHRFCIHKSKRSPCRSQNRAYESPQLIELDKTATIVFSYRLEAEVKKTDRNFEIWWFDFWDFAKGYHERYGLPTIRKKKRRGRGARVKEKEKDKETKKPVVEITPPYGHKIEIYNPLICTNCYQDFFGRNTPKYYAVTTKEKLHDEEGRWHLTAKSEIKQSLGPTTARGPVLAHLAAREGRRKLKRAAKHAVALKKRGFKPDLIDRGPSTDYEDFWKKKMKQDYKLLEDEMLLEVIDSQHGMGRYLNRAWNEWMQTAEIISFWDFLEKNRAKYGYSVSYIKETERPNYRIRIERGELFQGSLERKRPFDTSNMLSVSGIQLVEGWGIYVQSMFNEIYSGGAVIKGQCKVDVNGRLGGWTCPFLHHSSFLEGKPVSCAGEWMARGGKLISISMVTGHYKTPAPLFVKFLGYLQSRGIALRTISVKWLWPNANSLHYYNGEDFYRATHIEFNKEPYGRQGPLKEVSDPSSHAMVYIKPDPHSGDIDCAPSSRIPPRKKQEVRYDQPVGYSGVVQVDLCTRCKREDRECQCHLRPR